MDSITENMHFKRTLSHIMGNKFRQENISKWKIYELKLQIYFTKKVLKYTKRFFNLKTVKIQVFSTVISESSLGEISTSGTCLKDTSEISTDDDWFITVKSAWVLTSFDNF